MDRDAYRVTLENTLVKAPLHVQGEESCGYHAIDKNTRTHTFEPTSAYLALVLLDSTKFLKQEHAWNARKESSLVKAPVHVQGENIFGRKEYRVDEVDSTLDSSTHTPSTTIVASLHL